MENVQCWNYFQTLLVRRLLIFSNIFENKTILSYINGHTSKIIFDTCVIFTPYIQFTESVPKVSVLPPYLYARTSQQPLEGMSVKSRFSQSP